MESETNALKVSIIKAANPVKELVDEVDINRSTFYLHYTDIYQMLEKIEEEAMADVYKRQELESGIKICILSLWKKEQNKL